MELKQILILFILVFILIIWYYNKKEHFQIFAPNDMNIICNVAEKETQCNMTKLEMNDQYKNIISDLSLDENIIYFYDTDILSQIVIKDLKDSELLAFGFYIKIKNNNITFLKIHLQNDDSTTTEILFKKIYSTISIIYKNTTSNLLINKNDIQCSDGDNCAFFWMFINLDKNNSKLEIILNNTTKTSVTIDENVIKKIEFLNFNGQIGKILGWGENISNDIICNNYQCLSNNSDKTCSFEPQDLKRLDSNDDYNSNNSNNANNANNCIKTCFNNSKTNNCNIIDCQNRCLKCEDVNGNKITRVNGRNIHCPWYNNLRIKPSAPSAPKIRGFTSEQTINKPIITLEWRKPYHNMSRIINYIIEIKDLLYKNGTQIKTVPQENKDIFQIELKNLKPQTTYEICVRGVGEIRNEFNESEDEFTGNVVGKKSNILTITTGGENTKILQQTYDYLEGDYSNSYDKYQCSEQINSDHILNNIDHDDINIYKSLQNL
jgi:hypothetical protein